MKFVAGSINGEHLDEILENSLSVTESVKAAVAYATSDPKLFRKCWEHKIKLTFYGRYDKSGPVAAVILKKFLDRKSPNYVCKLVPDIFHSKIIWWKGYGVYIGSANLTNNAWAGNIESGIFMTDAEILENDLEESLSNFFDEIDEYSHPLTLEVYQEVCDLEKYNSDIIRDQENRFNSKRCIKKLNPLTFITKMSNLSSRREVFLSEWNETLQYLRDISIRVSKGKYRPDWIQPDVPRGIQADQFLHAYYYSNVKTGNKAMHYEHYEKNKGNPEKALVEAMSWWRALSKPPHSEDRTIKESGYLREKLDEGRILDLTKEEFIGVCKRIHALKDYSLRVKYKVLGAPAPLEKMNAEERINTLGDWIYNHGASNGDRPVLKSLHYLLYGGDTNNIVNRLWETAFSDKWKIPNLGISSLGEIVGWAMPELFPPRNGRTSKALLALGYKVKIYN